MKKKILFFAQLIILLFNFNGFSAGSLSPTNEFYVNDFADVLSPEVENYIIDAGNKLYNATTAQIVVVTVNTVGEDDIFNYSLNLARDWGIGDSESNNGCLIFLAIDDRKSYIQVGYGLEGRLTDGKTGRFQDDYLIPYLTENDYDGGVENLFKAIVSEVYAEYGITSPAEAVPMKKKPASDPNDIYISIVIPLIIFIIILWAAGNDSPGSYSSGSKDSSGSSGGSGSDSRGGGGSFGGGGSGRSW